MTLLKNVEEWAPFAGFVDHYHVLRGHFSVSVGLKIKGILSGKKPIAYRRYIQNLSKEYSSAHRSELSSATSCVGHLSVKDKGGSWRSAHLC